MTSYLGTVRLYSLNVKAPTGLGPLDHHGQINLELDFGAEGIGSAYLVFVPDGGTLGESKKRGDSLHFDVYLWMSDWERFVDVLRHELGVTFNFIDDGRCELQSMWMEVGNE